MADRSAARELVTALTTRFHDLPAPPPESASTDGPIGWAGYDKAHAGAVERTGESESVIRGTGRLGETDAVIVAFEFGFLGGSVGGRTGALVDAAFDHAIQERLPVVSLIATGGSRLQEGMHALSQLHRLARATQRARTAGIPHIAVLRDPSTGGGWATLGAGADVILAQPGAQVGFAGSRVRPPGDDEAYTAEAQLANGHVDQVVDTASLPTTLSRWLRLLTSSSAEPAPVPAALGADTLPATGWDAVQRARHPARPRATAYLDAYFDWHADISGDRCGGTDPAVRCGFGIRDDRTIAYAAQCGTPTSPAGYRTAARLVELADRLGIPVLTLVDTPGAANDAAAERVGAGHAIAGLFSAIAAARVPITTLVIGEGGSGGALAFAAPGRTWITPDAYFAVIAPEPATAILKRDPAQTTATADDLRLRPQDLVALGVAQGIAGSAVEQPHRAGGDQ